MKKLLLFITALMPVFVCSSTYAIEKENGIYQIGTAQDFRDFAEIVNDGEVTANAVLTADIDLGMNVLMVGTNDSDKAYQGTFDGKGHTIKINLFPEENYAALFRYVGWRAVVQNLKVESTIKSAYKCAAGIAGCVRGTIRNCWADVKIISTVPDGDGTHGGIAATCTSGAIIESCLAKVIIDGETTTNCGGIVGWANSMPNIVNCLVISDGSNFSLANDSSRNICRNDDKVKSIDLASYNRDSYNNRPGPSCYNNYVTNQWETTTHNPSVTVVPFADLATGRICYQLNNDQSRIAWVQEIGVDPFPIPAVFGGKQVYASGPTDCNGKADGELTFSNSGVDQCEKHEFDKYGICTNCGLYNFHYFEYDDPTKFDPVSRSVLLGSKEDIDLAEGMNRIVNGFKLHMCMVNDIEYKAAPGHYIFNTNDWIEGNFDGGGHALTIEMTEVGNYASFLPKMTGIFENVIMHGSISTNGMYASSVTSYTYKDKVTIRNVFSDIELNCCKDDDNTSAGIVGVAGSKIHIENVIYAGNINGVAGGNSQNFAGICGWTSGHANLSNCAFLGTFNNVHGDCKTISRNPANVYCENVYSLNDYGFGDNDMFILLANGQESVVNGELAFLLNACQQGGGNFYQKIGEDLMPMPIKKEGALVFANASEYRCDGLPLSETIYSNTYPVGQVVPDHQYDEGFCTVCGGIQEDFMTPVDGWFEISNGAELVWWSNYAAKHLDASARLTDDIDMSGYCDRWANVGTEGAPFYGNFDGQFHTISNLVVDKPQSNGVGLVAVMNSLPSNGFGGLTDEAARNAEGVYIKNVTLDESCSLTGKGYVALVGMTAPWAGHVNIKGVMMCGDVKAAAGPNAAGVFGCVMGSACHVTIDNCGMVGDVFGPKENGSFSSWLGDWAEVTNCFAVGEVEGKESDARYFARYGNSRVNDNIKNCYSRYGTQVPTIKEEDIANGKLTYILNGDQNQINFYQTIGEDKYPTLNSSRGIVYAYYIPSDDTYCYSNDRSCVNAVDQSIAAGNSSVMEINVKNYEADLVGFQMDLTLPEGVSVDKTGCALSSRITDEDQELVIGKLENGNYRIMSTSLSLTPISGNDGTLLTLKLNATEGCVGGQATISNIRFSTSESEKIIMDDETFDISVLYNLSYIVNGEEYKALSIPYGTTLTPESNLTREGYTFSGWSEIPETMPAKDVVVTGTFTINSYNLTYMVDGEEYKKISVVYGTTITPEEPTKEGYTFSGWSELPETMPARDLVVTATFTINSYNITYMVDGEEYKTSSVVYGATITPENEPKRGGYTFGGWSEIPETMPADNVVITGRFYLYGDVNTDEEVDVVDVVDIARFVVATPSEWFRERLADLNFDTTVNITDAVTLVNHIAGDQNFVKALALPEKSYKYDRCHLQLLSAGQNALSLCLNGEADFTAFQFDVDVPDGSDISAVRINGMRKDGHQLLFNKVDENRYRVTALSLSNAVFKGSEGELLQFGVNGKPMDDICVHDIHFVTTNGKDIIFDSLYVDGNETGISDVNVNGNNDVIYDLQGRKLSKAQRGVNIINGKKVLVNK